MSEQPHPFIQLLQDDPRYDLDAYQFVREALSYAQDVLGYGGKSSEEREAEKHEPHLTGQQLCEAIRVYAVEQFGYMARVVLSNWGIHSTGAFGDIVYNLINIEMMKKSPTDRRQDFDDVYDFDEVFTRDFKISMSD